MLVLMPWGGNRLGTGVGLILASYWSWRPPITAQPITDTHFRLSANRSSPSGVGGASPHGAAAVPFLRSAWFGHCPEAAAVPERYRSRVRAGNALLVPPLRKFGVPDSLPVLAAPALPPLWPRHPLVSAAVTHRSQPITAGSRRPLRSSRCYFFGLIPNFLI